MDRRLALPVIFCAALSASAAAQATALNDAFAAARQSVAEGRAVLRDSAKPLYPQLKACESADWSGAALSAPRRDADGGLATGYSGPAPSLVLLTKTAAYYYREDCDICAEVTRCDLSTGRLSSVVAAHSVDCADMKPYRRDALFDACPDAP